jgi:hypothetical protein
MENNCYDTESHFVAPVVTPITTTKLTDVDCRGNTGSIRYNVSGFGTGTYSYTVNGATAGANFKNFRFDHIRRRNL